MAAKKKPKEPHARRAVEAVLKVLDGRKGFDDWWDNIDDECKAEIEDRLLDALRPFMGEG